MSIHSKFHNSEIHRLSPHNPICSKIHYILSGAANIPMLVAVLIHEEETQCAGGAHGSPCVTSLVSSPKRHPGITPSSTHMDHRIIWEYLLHGLVCSNGLLQKNTINAYNMMWKTIMVQLILINEYKWTTKWFNDMMWKIYIVSSAAYPFNTYEFYSIRQSISVRMRVAFAKRKKSANRQL